MRRLWSRESRRGGRRITGVMSRKGALVGQYCSYMSCLSEGSCSTRAGGGGDVKRARMCSSGIRSRLVDKYNELGPHFVVVKEVLNLVCLVRCRVAIPTPDWKSLKLRLPMME